MRGTLKNTLLTPKKVSNSSNFDETLVAPDDGSGGGGGAGDKCEDFPVKQLISS